MGRELDLNKTAAHLIEAIHKGYRDFLSGNIRDKFETMWPEFDILKGQTVEAESRDGTIIGTASGLDNRGSLILKTSRGGVKTLSAGDVHLRRT
jgi:BirA family biotin operon repressor/biotin-[acetyl-CoA-carboxylase] ligase